ncbi:MAG: TIGR01212 family radical SAM protein [Bacteroidaceae bacterium]|nr:TIGR01212 family radical SAM protein [Bacteroidaceae bacterium]
MENNTLYNSFNAFVRSRLGCKVQKISVNGGFSCPNRDGKISTGGCTFCSNAAFTPSYCNAQDSVKEQLDKGIRFFSHKYTDCRYLAYFQSYTNTYAPLDRLRQAYESALQVDGVKGLIISTRPDCMSDELTDYLSHLSEKYFVLVEFGVESADNTTLRRINRGHTFEQACETICKVSSKGIMTGAHLILGLPGEDENNILSQADAIAQLPLTTIKLHQLQIIENTPIEREFREKPQDFIHFTIDSYISLLADYIERLNPAFVIDRFVTQSPNGMVLWPCWGIKSYRYVSMLQAELAKRGTCQGSTFKGL